MRNLIYVPVSKEFHYVHFRHFGGLKLRFLLNPTFVNRLGVVNLF